MRVLLGVAEFIADQSAVPCGDLQLLRYDMGKKPVVRIIAAHVETHARGDAMTRDINIKLRWVSTG